MALPRPSVPEPTFLLVPQQIVLPTNLGGAALIGAFYHLVRMNGIVMTLRVSGKCKALVAV
jgi:hypothetical protein